MARAKYSIDSTDNGALTIRDLCLGTSITNDAEAVVAELHRSGVLAGRRLYYFDTMGQLDELVHDGQGGFKGFAPGPRAGAPGGA